MDFADKADITGRLRALVIMLDDITLDQSREVDALIDADDFSGALNMLTECAGPNLDDDLRRDFEQLSRRIAAG